MRLHAGNLFGERALLKNEPRAASVTAVTEAEMGLLIFSTEIFTSSVRSYHVFFADLRHFFGILERNSLFLRVVDWNELI